MNRIYQVIWSSVKDCYVVVSENAGRHGKKKAVHLAPSTTKRTMLAMSLGAAVLMGSGAAAEAAATGENTTISGGVNGDASGKYSSISGGKDNVASGENSSISGGSTNTATGKNASISGGGDNEAIGEAASVSGGSQGKATGTRASVTGGLQNQAAGEFATVNGGSGNKAFGWGSSIIGGTGNVVGKMAVDENGNPKLKDSKGNDVVATIKTDDKGNTYLVDSKGNVIKDANPYTDPNSFAGSVAVAIGGMSSSVQGNYSVGIAGGSTSEAAWHGLAAGRKATVTMANGVAIGYESTASVINSSRAADKEGRIVSFGHQKGDVYYDVDYQNHTVTEHKYDSAAYNRLVNVADGIDDHDVVVMEQLKNAKAEAVATAKNQIKVKGDEVNVHAEETTDKAGVQTTTISLKPKVTLKESTDTTGAKQVVLDGTAGTISAGLSTDQQNYISLNGTTGVAKVGVVEIGNQSFTYTYDRPDGMNDNGTVKLTSTRATVEGSFVTGLSNKTWTPGNYVTGRAATEDQLEQAGRHFLSIKTAYVDKEDNPITPVAENTLANYYNDGATGSASMAFGVGTTAKGNLSLAMGVNSSASGQNSLAIGYGNEATGTKSVAVGNSSNASGNYSVAMGLGAQAGTKNTDVESTGHGGAVAVGYGAGAAETGSAAYGYSAKANAVESSAFGTSAQANKEGSIALGAHSVANREKGFTGYLAPDMTNPENAAKAETWVSTSGAVSLGGTDAAGTTISRQITNLAAGSEDSDAVNVAQLKALASQGMNFQGNDTTTSVHLDQGGTLQIQGSGRKKDEEYSTQNVKVLTGTDNKSLSIALDKNPTFDSVTAGTENGTSGGQAGSIKIVGPNSSSTNKATTITAGYAASPELAGTNGTGRISYTDGDGTAHTVATLGDGLKLAGDTGTGSVALDNTLTVSGGAKNLANGNNIGVTANGPILSLKLAKDITGLDTVTAGGVKMGTQTDGNDTTKSGNYVTGLDNKTWTVGQTQPVDGRAATENQLKSVSDVVNTNQTNIATNTEAIGKGLNFQANTKETNGSYKTVNRALGSTVAVRANDAQNGHNYKTDNLTTEIDNNGIITVKMDTQLTADKVTVGKDGNAITLDGSNGNVTTGSSTLGGTGLTIANGPSVTTSGISGGSQKITEVASGASSTDASGNPVYGTDTNGANIGDVKNIAAKTVTVSGDGKNTTVAKPPNADGTVDYKVSLNDSVTLGSDAGKRIALNGTAGTISAGDKVTLNGATGTATIGGATLGNDGTDTYLTGLTNKTWDPNNITHGRAATEDQLQQVAKSIVNGSATGGGFGLSADKADSTNATEVKQDLGSSIKITTGGDTNLSTQADSANKAIVVSLNKELNLTKTTLTDGTTRATTVVDGNGVVITPKQGSDADKVKLTTEGLSNGGKQITNVQSGLAGMTLENAAGDVLNHAANIGDLQTVSNGVKTELTNKGLNFKGNDATTTVHRNLGDTLTIQGTGADGRDYDGGANVQVKADKNANTLTVQLDRDLNAHTLTLGKETKGAEKGEEGSLILNGVNKDNGYSPVSIKAAYKTTEQDTDTSLKTNMSRLTYAVANEGTHTVATLEDGLQLAGDNGETLNTTLDKKVTIKGGVAKDKLVDNTTDPTKNNNIGVVASQDKDGNTTLSLQLAKDIAGLNTVTAGTVVMGYQTVISDQKKSETGSFVTGLGNTTWDGKDYVSGRAATEDQLKRVSDSIQNSVNNAQFGITADGLAAGGDVTIKQNLGSAIRIYGDAPVTNEKNDGSGDFWDRSKANILTKVKKDHDGNDYVSVELQDHLEVGTHAGKDTDGKDVAGVDGSMQFKGASAKEVNITGDTGIALSDGDGSARTVTAALRQDKGTGYLDLAGSEGAFTSLFAKNGKKNLTSDQDSASSTRLTYTNENSNTEHQVATMDDGLVVAGDNGQVTRLLNSTLKLSGGETDETKLSSGQNIGVVANKDKDGLDIKLAKDLTGIDSITGLKNTTIGSDFATQGRAATEEQLKLMQSSITSSITQSAQGGGFALTSDEKGDDKIVKQDLGKAIQIKGDTTYKADGSVEKEGNIKTSIDNGAIKVGLNKDVDLGDDGSIKAGGVTISNKGINAGNKNITNLASGIVNRDDRDNTNAANIGDVKTLAGEAAKTEIGKLGSRDFAGDDEKTVSRGLGESMKLSGGADASKLTGGNIGVVKNAAGDGLDIKMSKELKGLTSVTTGNSTLNNDGLTIKDGEGKAGTTITNSGIKIAANGDNTHAVEVTSSNVSMGGQQIHDVADGQSDGDAVNVSQLKKSVGALGGAIDKVDRRVDRVGAGAAALAALHPQDFDPDDKWDFVVGYGNYRGANAAAVGAFYRPNEDTTFSVGGTVGGGENMVNAGVSFKFGQGNHVSNSRVAMAKEIKDLRKEVESLRSALVDVAAGKQLDPAKTKLFPDMPKNHWAYKEISELAGNGLLDGYPDGEFKGDRMMTRYEFAQIVYNQMMAGRELSDRLVQEFEPELEHIRIDVIARHKDGTPSIERVRVNKPADKNSK